MESEKNETHGNHLAVLSKPESEGRFAWLRLSSAQTAFSATLITMASTLLSGLLGLVRTKYINAVFGAGPATDAYNAAFQLPDMLSYFLVGGVASISLITILNRYRERGDEAVAKMGHPDQQASRAKGIIWR